MSRQPSTSFSYSGAIDDIKAQLRQMRSASPFYGTGMHPNGNGGMDSDNYVAGASGYSFHDDGNAEFNQITLRSGIVGNDALTSPVAPGVIFDSRTNFALTTTLTNILTTTVTVPPGFTRAAVSVVCRVFAYNNTASLDYLYGQANIAGLNGYALPLAVSGSGGSGTNISPYSTVLTGLTPGGSFAVQIAASTSFAAWAANSGNTCETSGSVMWFR